MARSSAARSSDAYAQLELRYDAELSALGPLAERFLSLPMDDAARAFLSEALDRPHGALQTHAYRLLRAFMSDYDAYGLLGMYPMHLLSTPQAQRLLGQEQPRGRLLDVGAGDGGVTARLSPLFEHTSVIEASRMLQRRLRARGYALIDHDFAHEPWSGTQFDAIACLNVIDRCSHPRTLLSNLHAALSASGVLLLSVPLPLRPHVHVGRFTVDPEEQLPRAADASWETGAVSLAAELLEPLGWEVQTLSRLPYLCRGDAGARLHSLDAAVFVCRVNAHRASARS